MNEAIDTGMLPTKSEKTFQRVVQVIWFAVLVGPLPIVATSIFADLKRIQSLPSYLLGCMLWCFATLAFVSLVYSRWDRVARIPSTWISRLLFAAGIVCHTSSVITWSVSFAALGFFLHAGAWFSTHSGCRENNNWKLLIHWPALGALLQLPDIIEAKLAFAYKQLLSDLTAACFDLLSIPFRGVGFVFEFATTRISIEEVLVNSLDLTWMLFISCLIFAWLRRPLALLPAYLGVGFFWTLCAHLVHLVAIGVARHRYQLDVSAGWLSVLLIATTLCLAVGLILSSDRLLRILFMPVPLEGSPSEQINPIIQVWNRWLMPLAVEPSART